ncbi:hypothetical protein MF672_049810 [Actinomadura sp. ATCC 31491]|uniref:DUF6745 domain-containing protein n=1 Tax=Actinomadura luzonensis TaxID=2805427 RepID=A0ABT0GBT4_9ACTN|nr:hypothetical protein [Actinomadura luzonensis]MCK2221853.1 hypothetical protein [Actinomadura luzonensis]
METLTWERALLATGPGDGVEEAVRQAYREAGLGEPAHVITLPSPAAGALAAAWLGGDDRRRKELEEAEAHRRRHAAAALRTAGGAEAGPLVPFDVLRGLGEPGRVVREAVRTTPWERARRAAYAELGPTGWAALWDETGGRLWPQADRLITAIRRGLAELGGEELRVATLDAVLGQHDAPWLAAFDKLDGGAEESAEPDGEAGLDVLRGLRGLRGLRRVAGCAGWWWPYERVAIVTERPVELHLDDLGRLHRADGPALAYADGFALHAWHGMPVPADFGTSMRRLTPERIRAEENAELRRAMLEHFGIDRYLAESGAQPLQRDETGVLWRIDLPDDEPITMVEVVNSTPEPDGSRRTYFLRVPPWVRRAREGVAWTFGVEEKDYRPERET